MENQIKRRASRVIFVGGIPIGGNHPIPIQSMANTDPHDFSETLRQARALKAAGCEILRLTMPDMKAAEVLSALKKENIGMPLVADIHFDYRLALASIEAGADKIRINPGNIGDKEQVRAVVDACRARGIPIRIGVVTRYERQPHNDPLRRNRPASRCKFRSISPLPLPVYASYMLGFVSLQSTIK